MTANVLIVLLFSMLFILFVLTILAFYKCVDPNVIYTPMILEIITGIVSYIYTSRYEIDQSYSNLQHYKKYCDELYEMLSHNHISSYSFICEVINRLERKIEILNKKIESIHGRVNKLMEMLIIPLSLSIIGTFLDNQDDKQSIVMYVFTILVGVGFIYIILAGSVYLISNLTIKKQQEKYMQLANDLQSIVDFEIFTALLTVYMVRSTTEAEYGLAGRGKIIIVKYLASVIISLSYMPFIVIFLAVGTLFNSISAFIPVSYFIYYFCSTFAQVTFTVAFSLGIAYLINHKAAYFVCVLISMLFMPFIQTYVRKNTYDVDQSIFNLLNIVYDETYKIRYSGFGMPFNSETILSWIITVIAGVVILGLILLIKRCFSIKVNTI